ncbi:MAG: hypothetical protein GXY25_14025, partial [Pirellulaceae bacterium]|nr:hypothetical protein [Pirellulaceae bacterium]
MPVAQTAIDRHLQFKDESAHARQVGKTAIENHWNEVEVSERRPAQAGWILVLGVLKPIFDVVAVVVIVVEGHALA